MSQLPPEKLLTEFQHIDKAHADGFIPKDELWEFLSSGKVGEISESDFNALFDSMDLKKRGKVNFVAFCAFLGTCSEAFREVKVTQSEVRSGSSLRSSVQRLSVLKGDTLHIADSQEEP